MSFNTEFSLPPRSASPTLEEQENHQQTTERSIDEPTSTNMKPLNMAQIILTMHERRARQRTRN